jgi:hypothetical protein
MGTSIVLNLKKILIEYFVEELERTYGRIYSDIEPQLGNIIAWSGQSALENIANSDALYHDVDHTVMVTSVGQTILEGKHICEGGVTPKDWLHFIIALVCHDIGYVKGVCKNDGHGVFATGIGDELVEILQGGTDAALAPYHVDRSKLFVRERYDDKLLMDTKIVIDVEVIASYIEMTRFPVPDDEGYKDTKGFAGLVRAADLIGQLGDPDYLRKTPALFYEFEEIGANEKFGYKRPEDLRRNYARFFWNEVNPYIQDALNFLRVTQEGKQWISSLHSHVFGAENYGTSPENIAGHDR